MNMFRNLKLFILPTTTIGVYGLYKYRNNNYTNKYTYEEVKKHNKEGDVWVIHKDNVYDVSKFIENHPGGKDKIMLAAGKSVDQYWNVYRQHNTQNVQKIIETMKIGKILNYKPETEIDPYTKDPIRNPNLVFHSYKPCNAETPSDLITTDPITPSDLWYIRNHHPVPEINKDKFTLSIHGNKNLSIDDLKKFKETSLITTIQCGGNRRKEYNKVDKTSGTPWNIGAISTAKWTGVLLSDIIKEYDKDIKHVQFESVDTLKASVPIEKLKKNEILIAYKMNGEELPKDHGYPLRAIVPGFVGVRNVKWLNKIILSDQEADGPWQKSISYKVLPPDIKEANKINNTNIPTMQEMPLQSAITNIKKEGDKYIVEGYAWSGSGNEISNVEISNDDGITWDNTELNKELNKNQKHWAWTIWKKKYNISDNPCFICRAFDINNKSQPPNIKETWNLRGLNNNTWHKRCY
jgi:sulfite oxidase